MLYSILSGSYLQYINAFNVYFKITKAQAPPSMFEKRKHMSEVFTVTNTESNNVYIFCLIPYIIFNWTLKAFVQNQPLSKK